MDEQTRNLLTLLLASVAIGVSVFNLFYTTRRAHWLTRMASYQRLHEALVSAPVASGRRSIFVHARLGDFPVPRHEVCDGCRCLENDLWDSMNGAAAWYDTLATYMRYRQVPRKVALRAWYHPLIAIRPSLYTFLDHRARQGIGQPWAALQWLLEEVVWYSCRCQVCCAGGRPGPQLSAERYRCGCQACLPTQDPARPRGVPVPRSVRIAQWFGTYMECAGLEPTVVTDGAAASPKSPRQD